MALKKLLIAGIFALLSGDGAGAVLYQTAALEGVKGEIELISNYCHRHPQRCHRHRHKHSHWNTENWYHKDYRHWAKHCRHHPYQKECQRFCYLNRNLCPY